jgi:hypothetical protein
MNGPALAPGRRYAGAVMIESWRLWESIEPATRTRRVSSWALDSDYFETVDGAVAILICQGASIAADGAERAAGSGGRRLIRLGTAGGLADGQEVGDLVVSFVAIRDEGTSGHYLPSTVPACADPRLAWQLADALDGHGPLHGPCLTWTTDGRWVESTEQIQTYARLGARSVDMETAALFAVGQTRGFAAASVSVLADLPVHEKSESFKGLPVSEAEWTLVCDRARSVIATVIELAGETGGGEPGAVEP